MMKSCSSLSSTERRRPFWATQPGACGSDTSSCGGDCASPGLRVIEAEAGRTISTEGWISSLVLNILSTKKRVQNSLCGASPSDVGGHWSESFLDPSLSLYGGASRGYRVGSNLLQVNTFGLTSSRAVALIEATVQSDLQKLVTLGLATSVTAVASYVSRGSVRVEIEIVGPSGSPSSRVSLLGNQTADMGYYWSI